MKRIRQRREVRAGNKRAEEKHYWLAAGFGFNDCLNHLNQRDVQVWICNLKMIMGGLRELLKAYLDEIWSDKNSVNNTNIMQLTTLEFAVLAMGR